MEFNYTLKNLFRNSISKVGSTLVPDEIRCDNKQLRTILPAVSEIIDQMGIASMKAQGLIKPITTAEKLRNSEHTLYLFVDTDANNGKGLVIGLLKVGWKNLYVFDKDGECHNDVALCILDFYIHETRQRMGCGKTLFEHMLQETNVIPEQLAIDKPSDKFLAFLRKHYNLVDIVPQTNNFVVYEGFFSQKPKEDTLNCGRKSIARHSWSGNPANRNSVSYFGRHAAHKPEATIGQIIHSSPVL